MRKPDIRVGSVFRSMGKTHFSRPAATWTVTALFVGTDGLDYARLANDQDSSLIKTVSVDALTDSRLFGILKDRPIVEVQPV
jgi:hypothetical protein